MTLPSTPAQFSGSWPETDVARTSSTAGCICPSSALRALPRPSFRFPESIGPSTAPSATCGATSRPRSAFPAWSPAVTVFSFMAVRPRIWAARPAENASGGVCPTQTYLRPVPLPDALTFSFVSKVERACFQRALTSPLNTCETRAMRSLLDSGFNESRRANAKACAGDERTSSEAPAGSTCLRWPSPPAAVASSMWSPWRPSRTSSVDPSLQRTVTSTPLRSTRSPSRRTTRDFLSRSKTT